VTHFSFASPDGYVKEENCLLLDILPNSNNTLKVFEELKVLKKIFDTLLLSIPLPNVNSWGAKHHY